MKKFNKMKFIFNFKTLLQVIKISLLYAIDRNNFMNGVVLEDGYASKVATTSKIFSARR